MTFKSTMMIIKKFCKCNVATEVFKFSLATINVMNNRQSTERKDKLRKK